MRVKPRSLAEVLYISLKKLLMMICNLPIIIVVAEVGSLLSLNRLIRIVVLFSSLDLIGQVECLSRGSCPTSRTGLNRLQSLKPSSVAYLQFSARSW